MADDAAAQIANDRAMAEGLAEGFRLRVAAIDEAIAEGAENEFLRARSEDLQRAVAMDEGWQNYILIEPGHGRGYDLANLGRIPTGIIYSLAGTKSVFGLRRSVSSSWTSRRPQMSAGMQLPQPVI